MKNVNEKFDSFLNESGLVDSYKGSLDICLYHDLGLYGDIAESCIDLLGEKYEVDISKFEFEKYFPQEFMGNNVLQRCLYSFLPFIAKRERAKYKYDRLTLKNIKDAITSHKLV